MDAWDLNTARKLLQGVVPQALMEAYLTLLRDDGCLEEDADQLLGGPEVILGLTDRGMAHHWNGQPPRLVPSAPDLALQGILVALERRLLEDHEQLLAGHQRLGEMQRTRAVVSDGLLENLVEIVTDPGEIRRLSYSLINVARRDWMTLENLLQELPIDEASLCAPLPAFEGSVLCRSIYESRFLEQPVTARVVETAVEAGEKARLLPHIGMKMKLADETVAMLPLTPTGMEGALVIRSPVIVGALRNYFETLWESATPVGAVASADQAGLTEARRRVLALLASGLQDEAIARRLNVSVNTVRRHITEMRELLNVETRFAMGAAAQRRGWIE